ncbi:MULTISPECIES: hypothetical protein [Burkholderia cepacia complex]|nr:hypothetical protein [Burkholderia cenocepacia]SDR54684.1 hypothetical protein SAMN05443026_5832 [Burkholderia orbicola]
MTLLKIWLGAFVAVLAFLYLQAVLSGNLDDDRQASEMPLS